MIFILGGHGFVGSAFARYCEARGLDHAVIGRNEYSEFVGRSCDVLVNANGNSRKPLAARDPMADFEASVRSVRASLVDFPCRLYVYLSSCDVYPDCSGPSQTREDAAIEVAAQSPYGFHKLLAEQCVRHAGKTWLVVRQGGFVGPGLRKNAVFDILQGGPLWLDPASELQFLHTDDNARLVFDLVDRGVTNETVNLCGSGTLRLGDLIDALGVPVAVQPSSPRVRYEVSTEKVARWVSVPDTRATVMTFAKGRGSTTAAWPAPEPAR